MTINTQYDKIGVIWSNFIISTHDKLLHICKKEQLVIAPHYCNYKITHFDCTICLNCCQRLVLKSEQFILHLRALSSLSTPCQALKKRNKIETTLDTKVKVMSSLQPGSPSFTFTLHSAKNWYMDKALGLCPPIHGSKLFVK